MKHVVSLPCSADKTGFKLPCWLERFALGKHDSWWGMNETVAFFQAAEGLTAAARSAPLASSS